MSERWPRRVVVIGAGMGGLLAARVLADQATEVIVLERDEPPRPDRPRRCASQGHHLHVLLRAGVEVVEELFPGITAAMVEDGVEPADVVGDVAWFQYGLWRARFPSGIFAYPQSRPALEARVHERLAALPNVHLRHGTSVVGLRLDGERVTGVTARSLSGPDSAIDADLVIDSGGRGSQVFSWLEERGYPKPAETRIHTNLRYATRIFRRPKAPPDWKVMMMTGTPPHIKRGGAIVPVDRQRWMVTLAGYFDEVMPQDGAAFMAFARGLPDPAFAESFQDCEPLSDVIGYSFPFQRRVHVERLGRFPEGLVVLGDAICSFDPAFGQGMATVALQARALDRVLRAGRKDTLARRLFAEVARIVDHPWSIVTTEMFRFPQTRGPRSRALPALHWYGDHIAAVADHPEVTLQLTRIIHLMDSPRSLLRPSIAMRVARRAGAQLLSRARGT